VSALKPLVSFGAVALRDLVGRGAAAPAQAALAAAVEWLLRAHDRGAGGVSYGYCLRGGWRPPYRETSGYILETFFDLARRPQFEACRPRALAVARWLASVQEPDGSISNPRFGGDGIVFDTGQVLHGLVRAHAETGDRDFLAAAERAGAWLVRVADAGGRWTRHTYRGIPHVYNARVAWALLRLHALRPLADYERVARANLDWALAEQTPGGFESCAFEPGVPPFTHTLAYAIRGLLESGALLGDARYLDAARRGADAVLRHLRADGFLPGRIGADGAARAAYCCLTGNCQMSIIWRMLAERTGDPRYRDAALRALDFVRARQDCRTRDRDVRGAIQGSHPIWGGYAPFSYPNWAAKFFVDALLATERDRGAGDAG
jgi:hypothetical protein